MAERKYDDSNAKTSGKKLKEKKSGGGYNIRLSVKDDDGNVITGDLKADVLAKGNITNQDYINRKKAAGNRTAGNANASSTAANSRNRSFSGSSGLSYITETSTNFNPKSDNTISLGGVGKEFKNLYIDGTASIDVLSADSGRIENIDAPFGQNIALVGKGDTEIDARGANVFKTQNKANTMIDSIRPAGLDGQIVHIIINDANKTSIRDTSGGSGTTRIKLKSGKT